MSLTNQAGKLLFNSLSTETKWRLIKANARIICSEAAKDIWNDKRKLAITGLVASGIVLGIVVLSQGNDSSKRK